MAIFRNSTQQYSIVSHAILRDERLSLKDIGLLVRMLSLPDNWEFSENGLSEICNNDGQTSIRTALKNIEKCGYLVRKRVRDKDGKMFGVEWTIYDKPHLENHNLDFPNLDFRPQHNTKELNTKEPSIKEINSGHCDFHDEQRTKRFAPPTLDEVKAYCNERRNRVDPEAFMDFYTSNGWKVGKNSMKDWKAAVRTWERSVHANKKKEPEVNWA